MYQWIRTRAGGRETRSKKRQESDFGGTSTTPLSYCKHNFLLKFRFDCFDGSQQKKGKVKWLRSSWYGIMVSSSAAGQRDGETVRSMSKEKCQNDHIMSKRHCNSYIIVEIPPKWYFPRENHGPYSYGLNPRCRYVRGICRGGKRMNSTQSGTSSCVKAAKIPLIPFSNSLRLGQRQRRRRRKHKQALKLEGAKEHPLLRLFCSIHPFLVFGSVTLLPLLIFVSVPVIVVILECAKTHSLTSCLPYSF